MEIIGYSDKGIERKGNEDNFFFKSFKDDLALVAVADGMGGHAAGEVASGIAVAALSRINIPFETEREEDDNEYGDTVIDIIKNINREIYTESKRDKEKTGMGTTLTMGIITGEKVIIGHVGDSRAYHLSGPLFQRITDDHTVVSEMLKDGRISKEEVSNHPRRHMLTRALGTSGAVEIDVENISLEKGDILLFCTDGLTSLVSDAEIKQVLLEKGDEPEKAVQFMISLANNRGGFDNITVVIVTGIGEVAYQ